MRGPEAIAEFVSQFPLRHAPSSALTVEILKLTPQDGVQELGDAPCDSIALGRPPKFMDDPETGGRYLWVIEAERLSFIQEVPLAVLDGRVPKHTNLCGAGGAHVGGELWFLTNDRLIISGGSGRFPPRTSRELDSAVTVFKAFGYEAISLGWDEPTGKSFRIWDEGT